MRRCPAHGPSITGSRRTSLRRQILTDSWRRHCVRLRLPVASDTQNPDAAPTSRSPRAACIRPCLRRGSCPDAVICGKTRRMRWTCWVERVCRWWRRRLGIRSVMMVLRMVVASEGVCLHLGHSPSPFCDPSFLLQTHSSIPANYTHAPSPYPN